MFNYDRKVLYLSNHAGDMGTTWISSGTGGIKAVFVVILGWHNAVGRHEDRPMKRGKFLFLFPPCIALVAPKIRVFFEGRIVVGGQHFTMGIDIYTGALGLL